MAARDPHRFINELDEATLATLVERLESRAQNALFASLFDKYMARLALPENAKVLEIGTGTGAVLRRLAQRPDFSGQALGIDHSPTFIATAQRYAEAEQVADRIRFQVGDAHQLDIPSPQFDAVIAHTLISHVTDPAMVLSEMGCVLRPGGTMVVFDGDYASMTYAYPDHGFGRQMDTALASATFNNPRIMRDLPQLLPRLGLRIVDAWGDAVVEIGTGSYFKSFAETYAPWVSRANLLPAQAVEVWLREQRKAMERGTFFAACSYYTYLVQRA
jgi:SAM-dependent methyltransferase